MPQVASDPKEAVLEALGEREYEPAELIVLVQRLTQLDDLPIKDAVSDLLDSRVIEVSPTRKLRLRQAKQRAS